MSIGNLQDYGSKGTNFPWQLKMLQGIQGIITALTSAPLPPVPALRQPNILTASIPGSIPFQNYGFSISNIGTGNGDIDGITIQPGITVSFSPTGNDNLNAVTYDGTGTTLLITFVL